MKRIPVILLTPLILLSSLFSQCEHCDKERVAIYNPSLEEAVSDARMMWKGFKMNKERISDLSSLIWTYEAQKLKEHDYFSHADMKISLAEDYAEILYNYSISADENPEQKERFIQSMRTGSFHISNAIFSLHIVNDSKDPGASEITKSFRIIRSELDHVERKARKYVSYKEIEES